MPAIPMGRCIRGNHRDKALSHVCAHAYVGGWLGDLGPLLIQGFGLASVSSNGCLSMGVCTAWRML